MTMTGKSAGVEARCQRGHAREVRRQADDAEQCGARFEIAHRTEGETARIPAPSARHRRHHPTRRPRVRVHRGSGRAGIPTVSLQQYAGRKSEAVRVGTVEGPRVQAGAARAGRSPADPSETERERRERGRRELYVGVTRARDGLWVGVRSGASRGH